MNLKNRKPRLGAAIASLAISSIYAASALASDATTTPVVVTDPLQVMIQAGGMGLAAYLVIWMTRDFSALLRLQIQSTAENTKVTQQLALQVSELARRMDK